MAKKPLRDRVYDEFPDHTEIKKWFVAAVVDGDFSNVVAAIDSKIVPLENEFPNRFCNVQLSFVERLELKAERRANLAEKGLMAVLNEGKQASADYNRLSGLKQEIEFFQQAFALIRENFGNQEQLHTILLRAVKGNGIVDLQEALRGKAQTGTALVPEDTALIKRFAASARGRELLKLADALDGLKIGDGRS